MGKPLPAAVEQRQSRLTQDPRERSARANQSRALPGWDELPPLPGFTWTCWLQDPTMCSVLLLKRQKVDGCIVGFRDSSSSAPPGRQVLAELPQSVHACCGYALNPPWFFQGRCTRAGHCISVLRTGRRDSATGDVTVKVLTARKIISTSQLRAHPPEPPSPHPPPVTRRDPRHADPAAKLRIDIDNGCDNAGGLVWDSARTHRPLPPSSTPLPRSIRHHHQAFVPVVCDPAVPVQSKPACRR